MGLLQKLFPSTKDYKQRARESLDELEKKLALRVKIIQNIPGSPLENLDMADIPLNDEMTEISPGICLRRVEIPEFYGTLVYVEMKKGAEFPIHNHPQAEFIHSITGRFLETHHGRPVQEGEAVYFAPHEPHGVKIEKSGSYFVIWIPPIK